jgi:hypothetical protein
MQHAGITPAPAFFALGHLHELAPAHCCALKVCVCPLLIALGIGANPTIQTLCGEMQIVVLQEYFAGSVSATERV